MADVDWLLEINLHAVIRMTKAFLPQLLARPGSHVVNVSSLFGLIAPPGQTPQLLECQAAADCVRCDQAVVWS
jgi:NADP-dependent 3-hydroxy acid dehydrogenase YdfG